MHKTHDPICCIHGHEREPRRNASGDRLFTVVPQLDGSSASETVPMIRMRGRWLQELGFGIGKRVVVVAKRNSLVITLEEAK